MVADAYAGRLGWRTSNLAESSSRHRCESDMLFNGSTHADEAKINTPFILAPPVAAKTFYASVAGSRQLDPPYSNFYSFPCMDPPSIDFEFSGTRFQAMRGGRGMEYNSAIIPGGAFSLGRMQHGGGYCIGAIVETRMGLLDEKEGMTGSGKQGIGSAAASMGSLAGNGMRDVWVIGEPFFRGVLGAFDVSKRVLILAGYQMLTLYSSKRR